MECVGGDLTIKVEDNTRSGGGIYAEAVENRNQKVDDAEYQYAIQGSLVIMKVKPFQEKEWRHFIYNEKMIDYVREHPALYDRVDDKTILSRLVNELKIEDELLAKPYLGT